MRLNPIVKNAKRHDLPAILELEALFPSDAISRRQFLYHISNPRAVFLIVRDRESGPLLGYALFFTRKGYASRFYSLIVHPDARGKGFARLLCNEGLDQLMKKKIPAVFLEVDISDTGAIRLYESLGFTRTKIIKNYYEDGRDALKMKMILKA